MQKSHLVFIVLLTLFAKFAAAQNFENEPISSVFQKMENQSNFIFNYDPALLADYSFSGKSDFSQPEIFIKKLLYETPFEFETEGNSILVFLPGKRDFRICGSVKNEKYGESLTLANVFADDNVQGSQTDENGNFDFTFHGYKNGQISLSYVGFETQTFFVQEFENGNCKTIFLKPDPNLFGGEIVVTDYILEGITEGEAYNSVNLDYGKLAKESSAVEHDVLRTTQLIPGVTSIDESASNLQIRGGTADQNLVLWEGATLFDPGHFFGMISSINPFVVDEIKVHKGVFDPSYENRVGGVIDMSLTDIPAEKFRGGIGTTLSEAHAFLELPIVKNKASLIASGRHSISNIYSSPTLSSYAGKVFQETKIRDTDTTEQELNFYDYNGKILYRPTKKLLLKASGIATRNNFNFYSVFPDEEHEHSDRVNFTSSAFSFSAEAGLTENWQVDLAFRGSDYLNNYEFEVLEFGEEEAFYSINIFNYIAQNSFSLKNRLRLSADKKNALKIALNFGYEFTSIDLNFDIREEGDFLETERDFDFQKAQLHNFFGSWDYEKNKFSLTGGLRSTYYREVDFWAFSPRLNLQYALSSELKIKASGGIFHQFISQLNDFGDNELGVNNKVWVLSEEENGESQRAAKTSAGFLFRKNGWLIDLEAYANSTDGLNGLSSDVGSNEDSEFTIGNSFSRGIDFLVKKRWGNYRIWGSYTLSKVDFEFPEEADASFPASHDQRHNLSLLNSYKFKNWNFSLTWQYRSGLPFSSNPTIEEIDDSEDDEPQYVLNFEAFNNDRLKDYSRLDLGISYRPKFRNSKIQSEFSLSILNLLNRRNLLSQNYIPDQPDEPGGEPKLLPIVKEQLSITPLFLARVIW